MKDKVLYIHTARGGRAVTRVYSFPRNYRSTISVSLETVAQLLPLRYLYKTEGQVFSLDGM